MDTLVITEFAVAHVTMVLDDFAYMLGRQVLQKESNFRVIYVAQHTHLFPHVDVATFAFLAVPLLLH